MKQDGKTMDETRGEKNILAIYIGIFCSLYFFIYLCTAIENRHPAMSSKQASMCTKKDCKIETIFEMMDLKVKGVSKLDSPQNSPS